MVLEKLIREVGSKNINNDSIVSPNLNKYVFLDSLGGIIDV